MQLRLRHEVQVGARIEGRESRVRRVGQAASAVHRRLRRLSSGGVGGPDGYRARREEAVCLDAMMNLGRVAGFIERIVIRDPA